MRAMSNASSNIKYVTFLYIDVIFNKFKYKSKNGFRATFHVEHLT